MEISPMSNMLTTVLGEYAFNLRLTELQVEDLRRANSNLERDVHSLTVERDEWKHKESAAQAEVRRLKAKVDELKDEIDDLSG